MNKEYNFIKPNEKHLADIYAYRQEFIGSGDELHGDCALRYFDDPSEWLIYNRSLENHEITESDWIEFDQYIYVRKNDGRVVGMINYRSTNNKQLADYAGGIGFSVRPSERNKGYAKAMLKNCLEKYSERGINNIFLTCNKENVASQRTIIACGGVFDRISTEDENMERYIINVIKYSST